MTPSIRLERLQTVKRSSDPGSIPCMNMPKTTSSAKRHWFGTYHIDDQLEFNRFWEIIQNNNRFDAAAGQLEKAPETGALHVQFYVSCTPKIRFDTLKAILGDTVHLEACIDPAASWEYCTKEETRVIGPKTKGSKPTGKGARYDDNGTEMARIFRLLIRMKDADKKLGVTTIGF